MAYAARVALVTGASSGIGEVFARRLARAGSRVVLVARRKERLEALARELGNAEALTADLATDAGVEAVERLIGDTDQLDLLVNNAGFGTVGLFHNADADAQERMQRLHVMATLRLSRAALPGMVARARGAIVNVSSVAAFVQGPGNVGYCASKAWINSFSEGLHMEMRRLRSPVQIQALCPGFTRSEFQDTAGIDRRTIPGGLWLPAEKVVDASLAGLEKGKLFVVPGWQYKVLTAILLVTPRSLMRAVTGRSPRHQ